MRIFGYILGIFLTLSVAFGCFNNQKRSVVTEKNDNSEYLSAQIIGEYFGNLPCVDCETIHTVLELKRDNSYKLTYSYEGKSEDVFVKQGYWKVNQNKLVLNGVDYKYMIVDNKLFQLDLAGNEISGELADQYRLEKTNN